MRSGELQLKVEKTLAFYRNSILYQLRGWRANVLPVYPDRPVFVIGCSRAGTTLVYKTLSLSNGLGTLNRETHDLWAQLHSLDSRNWESHCLFKHDAVKKDERFISNYFYSRTGKLRFVDKNNQNGLCVDYLNALFPQALFVYVTRNPGDNIHSLIEGWRRADEYATWSDNLPATVDIDGGMFSRWCFFLFPGWREYVDSPIEAVCAEQFRSINKSILSSSRKITQDRFFRIEYERILEDPVDSFRGLYDFCGVPFTEELKTHSQTVLQHPYNAFSAIKRNKWLDSDNVKRIKSVLPRVEEVAKAMGYEPADYMRSEV
ncbi:sulfotransferase family protein [Aestuariirhabdus sp. LZHN29]|uniref:sulfotransferase family protein n=1 Tax=Aestuariirhabdus sp. LZHN29 TaxID=3417462 RepID=UPI003CF57474